MSEPTFTVQISDLTRNCDVWVMEREEANHTLYVSSPTPANKATDYAKQGFRLLTQKEADEKRRLEEEEQAAHIAEVGHDCWDFSEHYTFWNGRKEQDAYDCSVCGDNLQVG